MRYANATFSKRGLRIQVRVGAGLHQIELECEFAEQLRLAHATGTRHVPDDGLQGDAIVQRPVEPQAGACARTAAEETAQFETASRQRIACYGPSDVQRVHERETPQMQHHTASPHLITKQHWEIESPAVMRR